MFRHQALHNIYNDERKNQENKTELLVKKLSESLVSNGFSTLSNATFETSVIRSLCSINGGFVSSLVWMRENRELCPISAIELEKAMDQIALNQDLREKFGARFLVAEAFAVSVTGPSQVWNKIIASIADINEDRATIRVNDVENEQIEEVSVDGQLSSAAAASTSCDTFPRPTKRRRLLNSTVNSGKLEMDGDNDLSDDRYLSM